MSVKGKKKAEPVSVPTDDELSEDVSVDIEDLADQDDIGDQEADTDVVEAADDADAADIVDDFIDTEPINSEYSTEIVAVSRENWQTSDTLSLYEMTEAVGIRATQISQFANCIVPCDDLTDALLMAQRELMMRKSPLIVRRRVGTRKINGVVYEYYEMRDPNEMTFATSYPNAM